MNDKKIKVAVLLGGPSNEKEISLESGRNILYKLSPQKYIAIPLFVDKDLKLYKINEQLLVRNSTKEIIADFKPEMLVPWNDLPEIADFVFIGLHGGQGENGAVQAMLEMLNLPYNGSSVLTSSLCIDKHKTNAYLKQHNFEIPENTLISRNTWQLDQENILKSIESRLTFPLITKPHNDGCSFFVFKVQNKNQLVDALNIVFNDNKTHALVEEYIKGTELTVGVVGNNDVYALPPSKVVTNNEILSIEEKFLPGAGENQTPASLPKSAIKLIQDTTAGCYRALLCKGYARIDCFYQNAQESKTGQERVIILEVNTLPAMTPATCIFHQAAELGIKPMEFINLIIELGFEEHKQQKILYALDKLQKQEPI